MLFVVATSVHTFLPLCLLLRFLFETYFTFGSCLQLLKVRREKKALVGFNVVGFFSPKYLERFVVVIAF